MVLPAEKIIFIEHFQLEPFSFLKPASFVIQQDASIEIPPPLQEVHHEVELGLVIGKRGRDIPQAERL
eukprot:jgi/Mesen1/4963/ME000248S04248